MTRRLEMGKYSFGNTRPLFKRKRVIVIAAEGEITEPQYFSRLNSMSQSTVIVMVPNWGNGSDPKAVLKRMEKYLRENPLEGNDEAWIVLDQDEWPEEKLEKVSEWASRSNRHFALSIRRFEDWLRLHVDGDPTAKRKYQSLIQGKDKHIPDDFVTKNRIMAAAEKAERLFGTKKSVGNVFQLIKTFFQ